MKDRPADRQEEDCCPEPRGDAECDCCAPQGGGSTDGQRGGSRARTVAFALIMIVAVILAARSLIGGAEPDGQDPGQTTTQCGEVSGATCRADASACSTPGPCVDLASTTLLSEAVTGRDGVFVLLSSEEETANDAVSDRVDAAVVRLTDTGKNVVAITLGSETESFESLVSAAGVESFPSVVVVGPLGQLVLAEGEGRTDELLRAFVAATIQNAAGAVPCGTSCGK